MSLADASLDAPRRGPGRPPKDASLIRPPVRDDRLSARIAELRGNPVSADDGTDAFYIDPAIIPDGWSYEWKRAETIGKEDKNHMLGATRRGWEPVPADRHPEILVRQQGMILMERPEVITRESFLANERLARQQVMIKEAQLAGGDNLAEGVPVHKRGTMVRKSIEHQPIPD